MNYDYLLASNVMSAEFNLAKCSFTDILANNIVADRTCSWWRRTWGTLLVTSGARGCLLTFGCSVGFLPIIRPFLVIHPYRARLS